MKPRPSQLMSETLIALIALFKDLRTCASSKIRYMHYIPFPAGCTTCFKGVSLSHPLESMESSIMTGQLLCRPGACVSSAVQQQSINDHDNTFDDSENDAGEDIQKIVCVWIPLMSQDDNAIE